MFERLYDASLQLKLKKCTFFQQTVKFLGYIIDKDGIHTDPAKIKKVLGWPEPTCVKQLMGFLGFAGYYRKLVDGYAERAAPLTGLLSKKKDWEWESEHQQAFDSLKRALTQATVLGFPTETDPFILDTDASDCAISGVLSQVQNGIERVMEYASHTL